MAKTSYEKRFLDIEKRLVKLAKAHDKAAKSTTKHDEALKEISESIGAVNKKFDNQKKKTDSAGKGLRNLTGSLATLRSKYLIVGFAITQFNKFIGTQIRSSIETTGAFEALEVRLVGLKGSTDGAKEAFRQLNQVAATTPFTLQNVVEAGANLEAFGMNLEENIKLTADLAAFMGVDVVEAANALGRAFAGGAGAADILRERGILQLVKDFQQIDDLKNTTLPEFREALIETLQDPAAGIEGSTDRLSKTFVGSMSNMQDSLARLKDEMGKEFMPASKRFIISISNMADAMRKRFMSDAEIMLETLEQLDKFPLKQQQLKIQIEQESFDKAEKELKKDLQQAMESIGDDTAIDLASEIPFFEKFNKRNIFGFRIGAAGVAMQQFSKLSTEELTVLESSITSAINEIEELGLIASDEQLLKLPGLKNAQSIIADLTSTSGAPALKKEIKELGESFGEAADPFEGLNKRLKNLKATQLEQTEADLQAMIVKTQGRKLTDLEIAQMQELEERIYKLSGAKAIDIEKEKESIRLTKEKNLSLQKQIDLQKDLLQAQAESEMALDREKSDFKIQLAMETSDALNSILDSSANKELKRLDVEARSIRENVKNKREQARQLAAIDEKREAIEKKRHNRNLTFQQLAIGIGLFQSLANIKLELASANMKALSTFGVKALPIIMANQAFASAQTKMAMVGAALGIAGIQAKKMEQGGLVGGRRHSQGGTIIEAEQGEFVMSRKAVESVGIETMNRINESGGAGNINISFNGNVMSQDFIENEAIPMIKEAVRRGADIGVS